MMNGNENDHEYLRIGTTYYRKIKKPLASGDVAELLVPWSIECIKQDHGKGFLAAVPRYNGFCLVPNHLEYKREINNFYNQYHPFSHQPVPGYPKHTLVFLNHIFGEQLDVGLDYLKVLLLYPTQILPILCLVSTERNTGKTTFLNFLKAIYGSNMTINSNEDFRSNFNAEWAHKLIIGVDETFLDRKEDSERIKNLSTSKYYKIEAKGQDRQEIEFFGKFILCSNNEDNFIIIDPKEIRYWIRRLPALRHPDNNLLQALQEEIPVFIHYLIERPFATTCTTRMWFTPDQITTGALKKVKKYNRNKLEVEMAQIILTITDQKELTEICFSLSDMQEWLQKKGFRGYDSNSIKKVLQDTWGLAPSENSNAYTQYRLGSDGSIYEYHYKGRYYKLSQKEVLNLHYSDDFDEKSISI
jgi:hypothetical protein